MARFSGIGGRFLSVGGVLEASAVIVPGGKPDFSAILTKNIAALHFHIVAMPKNFLAMRFHIVAMPKNILALRFHIVAMPKNILALRFHIVALSKDTGAL